MVSLVTTLLLYSGSAKTSLFWICPLRGTVLPSLTIVAVLPHWLNHRYSQCVVLLCVHAGTSISTCNHLANISSGTTIVLLVIRFYENLLLSVFRSLGTVFRTCLPSLSDTCRIKRSSNDMVTRTWKIFYPSSANQDNAMLLKVVTFARDIACYHVWSYQIM